MMRIAVLALTTGAMFLILDAVMLTFVMQPLFARHIGPIMADPMRLGPAVAFYLLYLYGLLALVSLPALRSGAPAAGKAFVLGLVAYGTFELTAYAILRDWALPMVVVDMLWGGVLTAVSCLAGLALTRKLLH